MNAPLPLLNLFRQLQSRGLALGLPEYLEGLKALETLEVTSRADLRFLCQSLWGKSREEQQIIGGLIDALAPNAVLSEPTTSEPRQKDRPDPAQSPTGTADVDTRAEEPPVAPHFIGFGSCPADQSVAALSNPETDLDRELAGQYDLRGDLPVPRHVLTRIWRRVRRMARSGPATLLDLDATLDRLVRERVLVDVVRNRERRNAARVAILLDVSPAMVPFRRLTQALLDTAEEGGPPQRAVYYYRDAPEEPFFQRDTLHDPVPRRQALTPFADAGVLILGEAGAARGDEILTNRLNQSVKELRTLAPRLAWLNPMPRSRWHGTSADVVAQLIPMFSLEDRSDLRSALDLLRGRRGPLT